MSFRAATAFETGNGAIQQSISVCATEHFRVLDSTQTYLKNSKLEFLRSQTDCPTLVSVSAEHQTAGRGKGDRKWFSDPANKCLALSMGFPIPVQKLGDCPILTQFLALSVIRSVRCLPLQMKWPNDLMLHGKKVGGILAETEPLDDSRYAVIIGVGLNLDIDQNLLDSLVTRWPSTSLQAHCDFDINLDFFQIRDNIVQHFSKLLHDVFFTNNMESKMESLMSQISDYQFLFGQYIRFHTGSEFIEGHHRGVSPKGGLVLETGISKFSTFYSGEIVFIDK